MQKFMIAALAIALLTISIGPAAAGSVQSSTEQGIPQSEVRGYFSDSDSTRPHSDVDQSINQSRENGDM